MTRDRLTAVLTTGALLGAFVFLVARKQDFKLANVNAATITQAFATRTQTPEDTIYAMLDAAKSGSTEAYLASYTGPLKDTLQHSLVETTPQGFEKYLRSSNLAIQGVALTPPEAISSSQAKLRVEYVYKDRNEVQLVYLQKVGSGWKIYQVDSAQHLKTLVPYGSAVSD